MGNTGFFNIPVGKCLYYVPSDAVLYGPVLGTVPTVNLLHMAVVPLFFGETFVSSLFVHLGAKTRRSPVIIL